MRLLLIAVAAFACACAAPALRPISMQHIAELSRFKYVFIEEAERISAAWAANGRAATDEVDPAKLIEGALLKKGIVRVATPGSHVAETLIIKWGISGKRDMIVGLKKRGYAQEITITALDAKAGTPVFVCSAEGYGSTEAGDIRDGLSRCLSAL